jgi:hypothetical protein
MVFTDNELQQQPLKIYLVLFVAYLLHPIGGLAIELFLNGDMSHSCGKMLYL